MKCIYCSHLESKVVDSRSTTDSNSIRRRRECLKCGRRFTTYETIETTPILVVKSDGKREPFDTEKIKHGIIKACEKRPINIAQIEEVVAEIEKKVYNTMKKEIKTDEIGKIVMDKLKGLDKVAYIRFASVYRQFEDVTNFKNLLEEL